MNKPDKSKPASDVTLPPPELSAPTATSDSNTSSRPLQMDEDNIHAGKRIGKYLIRKMIGRGGMGAVYEAMDVPLQRKVALKILPREFSANEEALQRFIREARLAARLNHPNVVTVFDVGKKGTIYFIAMELVPGTSGQELLESGHKLDWREATRAIVDACRALSAAHDAGLIHRDIKPGNLLWSQTGEIKLSDFGLAKPQQTQQDLSLTRRDAFVGTPLYMSPEQCRNDAVDHRSDLYALGATYYTLLTGNPPYNQGSAIQILFAHCSAPIPDVRTTIPDVPALCSHIVQKAMAKNAEDRYQNARQMRADLEALLGGATDSLSGLEDVEGIAQLAHGDPASAIVPAEPRGKLPVRLYAGLAIAALVLIGIVIIVSLALRAEPGDTALIAQAPEKTENKPLAARSPAVAAIAPPVAVASNAVPQTTEPAPTEPAPTVLAPRLEQPTAPLVSPPVQPAPVQPAPVEPAPVEAKPEPAIDPQPVETPDASPTEPAPQPTPPAPDGVDADDPSLPRDPLLRNYAIARRQAIKAIPSQDKDLKLAEARGMILWHDFLKASRKPLLSSQAPDAKTLAERLSPGISKIEPRVHPGNGQIILPPPPGETDRPERPNDERPRPDNRPRPPRRN